MANSILDFKIYPTPADLPEGLQGYAHKVDDTDFYVFRHPFISDMMPLAFPVPLEEIIQLRTERAEEFLANEDVGSFVFAHERPFRMDILRELVEAGRFGDNPQRYWEIAREVWMDSEQPEDDLRWTWLLNADVPGREFMTDAEDRDLLASLPDEVEVFRGVQGPDEDEAHTAALDGWSWSLSEKTAAFFARRYLPDDQHPFVVKGKVQKSSIIAYLPDRNEAEVLLNWDDVEVSEICEVSRDHEPRRPGM